MAEQFKCGGTNCKKWAKSLEALRHHAFDMACNGSDCVEFLPEPLRTEALAELAEWHQWKEEEKRQDKAGASMNLQQNMDKVANEGIGSSSSADVPVSHFRDDWIKAEFAVAYEKVAGLAF